MNYNFQYIICSGRFSNLSPLHTWNIRSYDLNLHNSIVHPIPAYGMVYLLATSSPRTSDSGQIHAEKHPYTNVSPFQSGKPSSSLLSNTT
jgi:hypothetical protein